MADLDQRDINKKYPSTINDTYEDIYTLIEKKSRFICHLLPISSEKEAVEKINYFKKKYYDASHNCYAYILYNEGMSAKKFSDDGEPKGTAGIPMLKVLEAHDLCNILAVVTRYFGGTLLGAGGLVRAYTKSVSSGLNLIKKVFLKETNEIDIITSYHDYGKIERFLKENSIIFKDPVFSDRVELKLIVLNEKVEIIKNMISDLTNAKASIHIHDMEIREVTL